MSVQIVSAVVASVLLTFGLYLPRHRRGDMVVGLLVLSLGVAAMTLALSRTTSGGAGLGLGLFAILSIVRLRSSEIAQQDVAYYFAALTLGVLAGLRFTPTWWSPTWMAVVLVAVFIGDHPRLFGRFQHLVVQLDRTFTDDRELREHVAAIVGYQPSIVRVLKIDQLRDSMQVDVRYLVPRARARGRV